MIYKDLSLLSGGGIIPSFQLVDSNGCANIIIGLGGTGIDCLKEAKKQVYNRIKPDDNITSDIPIYQNIQFLAIDSDRNSINDETFAGIDPVNEYFDIGFSDIHSILNHSKILRQTPSLRWLSDRISIHDAQAGAGGVRQVGRLLMMMKSDHIKEAIVHKVKSALHGVAGANLNIHIFTGMGGGTGSGIFLDICYIIRHIIQKLAIGGRTEVAGYFFLPDVNIGRVPVDAVRKYITINGYAAMKELDYCMNFNKNGGEWNQEYVNYKILSKQAPVDNSYLVSSIDINGDIKENGYKYAVNVVADYVTESLTYPYGLHPIMHPAFYSTKRRGACYNYYAIGGSRAYVPYKDICTYLAARIFEAYQKLPVTNNDIDAFISDNGLTYRNLLNAINKDVKSIPFYEVDTKTLIDQVMGITPDVIPNLLFQMRDAVPKIKDTLTSNRENLIQSVIVDIKDKLIEVATIQGKGSVYASLFLSNSNRNAKDFGNVIDGYMKENNQKLLHAVYDLELREQDMHNSLLRLQNTKLNKRKKAMDYVSDVHSYYSQLAKIDLYKEMGGFLYQLKQQVFELNEKFFSPINTMLSNVAETFKNNIVFFDSVTREEDYAVKTIGLNDESLKVSLNATVESIDTVKVVNGFIEYMIRSSDEWLGQSTDSKVCAAVSEYFIQQLSEFTYEPIDYYLQEKSQMQTQKHLADKIYNELMVPMRYRSKPLFWGNELFDERFRFGYCFIPNTSNALSNAANQLCQVDSCFQIIRRGCSDSISMFTLYCGMPMYMYQPIFHYKHEYDQSAMAGVHIYEGTELDQRDFRKLHSVIPLSLYSDNELEDVKDFVNDYDRAVENEIIYKKLIGVPNRFEYQIRLVDDEVFFVKRQRIEAIIKKCSNLSVEENMKCIEETENFLKEDNDIHVRFKNYIALPNNGAVGYEDSVVRDYVFASEYYTTAFYEQLRKIDELDSIIQRLRRQIAHFKNG